MNNKGQSLVFFVALIPLLFIIFAFIFDTSLIIRENNRLESITTSAINYLAKENKPYQEVENIINKIEEIKKSQIWNFSETIYKNVDDISEILDYINIMFFEKGKIKPQYLNCIGLVENAKRRLKANSNYNMTIDNLLLQIWEEINEKYSRG